MGTSGKGIPIKKIPLKIPVNNLETAKKDIRAIPG